MNVSLRQLRAFVQVAKVQSFTKAAEQLHITQAGLSGAIRELEGQLSCRLFDRTTRYVTLTESGHSFLPVAERVIEQLTVGATELSAINQAGRLQISIGATPLVASSVLQQVCERFAVVEPSVRVAISDIDRGRIQASVMSGELDVGYGAFLSGANGLLRIPLLKVPLLAIRTAGSPPLSAPMSCEWKDLEGLPFVGLPPDNPIQQMVERTIAAQRISIAECQQFEHIHTVLAMVEAGLGVAVLPSFVRVPAQRYRVVLQMLSRPTVTCDFYQITKKGRVPNAALAGFSRCFRQVLAQAC